ncbi:nuclear envelope pore membrane protein POM 121-like [Thomomys bottae]
MGSYLSRDRPHPQSPDLPGGHYHKKPMRLGSLHHGRRVPPAFRIHSVAPSLNLSRRLTYEDRVASASRRQHCRRLVIVHRQRYPAEQARCLFLGVFSSATWNDQQKKSVLSASSSKVPCPSVSLNLASAKGKVTLRLALQQSVLNIWSSFTGHLSFPYAKEIVVIKAPGDRSSQSKAKQEEDEELGDRVEGLAKLDSQTVSKRHQHPGKASDGRDKAPSAFRRLVVNGVLSSFIPRPGPLKREFCHKNSLSSLISKSQTFMSSCSKRNAITSSYSSTGGFSILQKKKSGGATGLPSSTSFCTPKPLRNVSEKEQQASSSASVVPQRKIPHGNVTQDSSSRPQQLRSHQVPSSDLCGPQKRKTPLLMPWRRNDPLILPPPPEIGYPITTKDLDLEKTARVQWINKILKEDGPKTHSN